MNLVSIGTIKKDKETFNIEINPEFIPALKHVEDFSHIQVLWWAHLTENPESRSKLKAGKLFKKGPEWCAHWPQWQEEVAGFDWSGEVNL